MFLILGPHGSGLLSPTELSFVTSRACLPSPAWFLTKFLLLFNVTHRFLQSSVLDEYSVSCDFISRNEEVDHSLAAT